MEGLFLTRQRTRRRAWRVAAWAFLVGLWAAWGAGEVHAAPHPWADSPETPDTPDVPAPPTPRAPPSAAPTSANTLGMLLLSRRAPIVVVAGGRGSTAEDIMNYYLPVIMAEMDAPVSTRDPSIIRVAGCRQGFNEDPVGGCRQVFVPRPYYPRSSSTRPNRQASIASLLPIRPRPRVSRPQIQTQRDLIRQFNTSRRRPGWFGRSLSPKDTKDANDISARSLLQDVESPDILGGDGSGASEDVSNSVSSTTPDSTTECDD